MIECGMGEKLNHLAPLGMSHDVIRKLVKDGTSQTDVARTLGVSRQRIGAIVHPRQPAQHDFFYYARINMDICSKCGMGPETDANTPCQGRRLFGPNQALADLLAKARAQVR